MSFSVSYFSDCFCDFVVGDTAAAVVTTCWRVTVFSSRHGVIFETVGSLLSLLRTGARDAYRLFFIDAMLAVEGKKKML